jgi:hypothetical protein
MSRRSAGERIGRGRAFPSPLDENGVLSVRLESDHDPGAGAFSPADAGRLDAAVRDALDAAATTAPALLGPVRPGGAAAALTDRHCRFDHCGVLLFPRTLAAGLADLRRRGLAPGPVIPSTVVRRRLAHRYGLDPRTCDVHITRLGLDLPDGRRHPAVEVFLLPRDSAGFTPVIEASELAHGFEAHLAFVLRSPTEALLRRLAVAWQEEAGLWWEDGGHNPHEGGPHGATVVYFVRDHRWPSRRRRFELHCTGDLRSFLGTGSPHAEAVDRAYAAWTRPDTHLAV